MIPLTALALLAASTAQAPAAPACQAMDAALPASLAAWRSPSPAGTSVVPGQAVTVPLRPMGEVQLAPPGRPARDGNSTAAAVQLAITSSGTYGVALDQAAWIDLVASGQSLRTAAHGHGPDCSTIRKIVDFQLAPGTYTIQLSGTSAASVRLLVVPR